MLAMRWLALGVALAGCLHGTSHPCTGDDGVSWVCPDDKVCAAAPVYCGTAAEVGACDGKMERDPCATPLVQDGLCISSVCESCSNDLAGCRYVGWNPMTSVNAMPLNGVAFTGFGEAYAIGPKGTVLHYDTSVWAADLRFPTLPTVNMVSIVTAGANEYVLGDNSTVYVLDHGAWTARMQLTKSYVAMWAAPTGEIFVVGPSGVFAKYDGTTWVETVVGAASMYAVWGTSATDVYAVGQLGPNSAIEHYDGSTWSPVTVANAGILRAVWGTGNEVFAMGSGTMLAHGVAGAFSLQPIPSINARGIWGSAVDDVFIVGDSGTILHWDGASWTQLETAFDTMLYAISGSSAAEVFAVGDGGAIERYTGLGWAHVTKQPVAVRLRDIWAAAPNEAFAVGNSNDSTIFHWTNGAWQPEMSAPAIAASLVSVWGRSSTDVLAVGQLSGAHRGASPTWMTESSPLITLPVATWGTATMTYSVGVKVVAFDGATWSEVTTDAQTLDGVWVAPSGKIWVAGLDGVGHVEGSAITFDVGPKAFASVWGSSESDVFAVGAGDIHHYDGTAWTPMTVPTSATLARVWGRGADDVFAVGAGATALRYHAGIWKTLTSPYTNDFTSVSGAGDSIYVTTSDGKVYLLVETAP